MRNRTIRAIGCILGIGIVYYGIRATGMTLNKQESNRGAAAPLGIGEEKSGEITTLPGEGRKKFKDTQYQFSFIYPDAYDAGSFGDVGQTTLLLTNKDNAQQGIQIAITPFDEDIQITPDRLRKDIPTIPIMHPQAVTVGNLTYPALFFESHDASGDTYEVWFTDRGNLYEITAGRDTKDALGIILNTWQRD